MKKILIVTIVILGLCMLNANIMAEPVVEEVTIDPAEPTPSSTVTITATITGEDDIDAVHLTIQECKGETLCFRKDTKTMNLVDGNYQYAYKLQHEDATFFKYNFSILSNGEWFVTEQINVTLKQDSSNGDTNGGDGDGSGTPGFELIPLLIAIFVGVLLLKRKRSR